ncbi:hypothetical protein [Streptomyces fradiae]|uniref:hypothetical protein n=1 Tax=Streptomyces fradiae TaxID=1906 RepID=UPI003518EF72
MLAPDGTVTVPVTVEPLPPAPPSDPFCPAAPVAVMVSWVTPDGTVKGWLAPAVEVTLTGAASTGDAD